jgi:DNA polymerase-3 subunit epsilon
MTRGQESLLMDMDEATDSTETRLALDADIELIVLPATKEELEAHNRQLDDIDAVAKSGCLWKQLEL